ncbi:MAG: HlyD family efflux transporter periplasmic adaptor subunit [Xanthobacteraceae bacterium]|nr:HlyD family efflux transporter periplasmic adaptor subunit [Xanthobacteraceae bacterium]
MTFPSAAPGLPRPPVSHPRASHPRAGQAAARRLGLALAFVAATASVAAAAEETPGHAAAVTVLRATKACFSDTVDVFGILLPRDEIAVRPDRPGLKVAEVLADAGETVTKGQILAKLALPNGDTTQVEAPAAGLVAASSAVVGAVASGKGEALFNIITGTDFDLAAQVPTESLPRLKVDQPATIKILGTGSIKGKVRRVAATVEPNTQLGQVFISATSRKFLPANSPGRASIKTGESCGVSVPLTAILYSSAGTVIQVIRRDRVETRRVETGLMAGGKVEIREGLSEGEIVVARAGALLREGDPVRPIAADTGGR